MIINRNKYNKLNNVLLALSLLFYNAGAFSQINDWLKMYAEEEGAPAKFDHLSINIYHTNWIHSMSEISQEPYSLGADFGFFKDVPLSKKGHFSFAFGANYSFNNVHHNGDIVYSIDSINGDYTYTNIVKTVQPYRRNKLFTSFIEVPIEFRLRTVHNPTLRFYAGFKGGWLMISNETRATNETKHKIFRIKNLNRWHYGPTLKIGFKQFNLYGFYSLTTLFKEGRGPEITPFNLGLSIFVL